MVATGRESAPNLKPRREGSEDLANKHYILPGVMLRARLQYDTHYVAQSRAGEGESALALS